MCLQLHGLVPLLQCCHCTVRPGSKSQRDTNQNEGLRLYPSDEKKITTGSHDILLINQCDFDVLIFVSE